MLSTRPSLIALSISVECNLLNLLAKYWRLHFFQRLERTWQAVIYKRACRLNKKLRKLSNLRTMKPPRGSETSIKCSFEWVQMLQTTQKTVKSMVASSVKSILTPKTSRTCTFRSKILSLKSHNLLFQRLPLPTARFLMIQSISNLLSQSSKTSPSRKLSSEMQFENHARLWLLDAFYESEEKCANSRPSSRQMIRTSSKAKRAAMMISRVSKNSNSS